MLFEELFVGQRWDVPRGAARLECIGRVGEQRFLQLVVQDRSCIGQRAFHLVEDNAVVYEFGSFGGKRSRIDVGIISVPSDELVMPTFLFEYGALLVDARVENRIKVHVHQVVQVLLVGRSHRVERLVRKSHGVQERLHRAFQQVDERLFDRELPRSAQHRVFEDVKHARVIARRCAETDGERLVVVVVFQVQQLCAADVVNSSECLAAYLAERLVCLNGETAEGYALIQLHGMPFATFAMCSSSTLSQLFSAT